MNQLDRETRANLAGLFDGEGHVCIIRQRVPAGHYIHRLLIGITQKNRGLLDRVKETVGAGWVHRKTTCFQWELTGPSAKRFLLLLLPWLFVKQQKAEFAIAYQERLSSGRYKHISPNWQVGWFTTMREIPNV